MQPEVLFFLGQTSDLCYAELECVLARLAQAQPERLTEHLAQASLDTTVSLPELQLELGGTIKTARVWETLPLDTSVEDLTQRVTDHLALSERHRFAIAETGRDHLPEIDVYEIKARLQKAGVRTSFQESSRHGVNGATWKFRKVAEVHVVQLADRVLLADTQSVQDVDTWSERDMDKPVRDRKRGMLQPKVARMMVNLALGQQTAPQAVVLDPFCGTGTTLLEAADAGVRHVIGSDNDHQAILATRQNLDWWKATSEQEFTDDLMVKNSENLQPTDFTQAPTCIATEPYLGRLTPKRDQLDGIIRGLEKLYRGMFRAYGRILQPGNRVVTILPAWPINEHKERTVSRTIDELPQLGFRVVAGPLRAGRASAHTQRYVYVLEYDPYGTR